jgi:hypothetical protein
MVWGQISGETEKGHLNVSLRINLACGLRKYIRMLGPGEIDGEAG